MPHGAHRRGVLGAKGIVAVALASPALACGLEPDRQGPIFSRDLGWVCVRAARRCVVQHEAICVRTPERARARGGGHPRRHCAWRRPTAAPHAPPPRRWGRRGAAGPSPGRGDAARARSRRLSRILDGAAPHAPAATTAKKTRAGPPAQVQDRAGHARFGAGIKFQAPHAIDATLSPRPRRLAITSVTA